jgi:hypothetical protein
MSRAGGGAGGPRLRTWLIAYTLHNNPSLAAHRAADEPQEAPAAGRRSTDDGHGAVEAVAVGGATAAGAYEVSGSAGLAFPGSSI